MSIRGVQAAAATKAPSHSAKLVMFILGHRHNYKTGDCYPSIRRIALESGLSVKSVTTALKDLVDLGLIKKKKRQKLGGNPHETSNSYFLVFLENAPVEQLDLFPEDGDAAPAAPRGAEAASTKREGSSSLRKEDSTRAKRKRSQRPAPKRRVDDWKPTAKDIMFATASGFTEPEAKELVLDFIDFWTSEGEVKASWSATWQRWVRKRAHAKESGDGKRTSTAGRGAERLDRFRRFDAAVRKGPKPSG